MVLVVQFLDNPKPKEDKGLGRRISEPELLTSVTDFVAFIPPPLHFNLHFLTCEGRFLSQNLIIQKIVYFYLHHLKPQLNSRECEGANNPGHHFKTSEDQESDLDQSVHIYEEEMPDQPVRFLPGDDWLGR